jgi:tRNA threonylcarbamoyl adenosine modification protein YeaZ
MITLALDTSTSQGGVALLNDDQVLSRHVWSRGKSHSELLTPTIEACFKEAGLEPNAIQQIAVGRGPGSFTGIRIGVNAARSLGYALGVPVRAFDTTEILAAGVQRHDLPVITLLNAQMNLLFASTFVWDEPARLWRRERALEAVPLETIESWVQTPHLFLGDGFLDYEPLLGPELRTKVVRDSSISDHPLPEVLGHLAFVEKSHGPLDWNHLQPLYIRASGAEEKRRGDSGQS